jgi:type III secretory pathway component EscR
MVIALVTLQLPFVAVTVYVADVALTVGVPVIEPVEVFNDNPLGKAGLTE